jgi:hypothetical protein
MPRKKKEPPLPILIVPKNATMRQIYAAARKAFTAADLARFADTDEGVPAEQVLAELEAIQSRSKSKRKR